MNKNLLLAAIMMTSLYSSYTLSAIPGIDVARVGALMTERLDDLKRFRESMDSQRETQSVRVEGEAAKIDAFNSGSQVHISRETQNQSDLYNMKQLLESLPTQMACEQTALQANLDTILCNANKSLTALNDRSSSIDNPSEQAQRSHGNTNRIAELYGYKDYNNDGSISELDVQAKIANEFFGDSSLTGEGTASLIVSSQRGATNAPDITEKSKDAIMLLVPKYSSYNHDYGSPETPEQIARHGNLMRDEAIRSVVFHTYNEIISSSASSNPDEYGPSLLHAMRMQSDVFYNTEDPESSIAHQAALDPVSSPTQLMRHLVTAKAKQLEGNIQHYEHSLKDELQQAIKVSILSRK